MKFVKLTSYSSKDEVLAVLRTPDRVNQNVKFDDRRGRPTFFFNEGKRTVSVRCQYIGGPSKDNGFIEGTRFIDKLKEKNGQTVLSGIITTAPIYHTFMLALTVLFLIQCITLGGISVVPICILAFSLLMYKDEFKKQGLIHRHLERTFRYISKNR